MGRGAFFFFGELGLTFVIPTGEPSHLTAGDTWTWLRRFSQFPPTDVPAWTITYILNGPSATTNIVASVDPSGRGWLITQLPSVSSAYLPGTYQWAAKASRTNGGVPEQYEAGDGVFTIIPNIANLAPATSFNQTMLAQIRAVLLNRSSADVQDYTIDGRRMVKIPIMELVGLESIFAYRVAQERRPGKPATVNKVVFRGENYNPRVWRGWP